MQRIKADFDKQSLYRMIWRWHFYAGLFCIPFVILLSVTGAIYLFKPQIESWQEAPYRNLPATEIRKTPNEHIAAALTALPNAKFHTYRLPANDNDAIVVSVFSENTRYLVYVNPFDLSLLAVREYLSTFIQTVRALHGELLIGDVGSILVELAACWAVVLILSGLYLWWPRSSDGLAGVLYPRLRSGSRRFWRELHSVTGIWVSSFALFLLISGLPWALVWGNALKEVRSWAQPPVQQDWSTGKKQQMQSWKANIVENYDLNATILSKATSQNYAPPVYLSVSDEKSNIWKVSSLHQNRPLRSTAWIDGNDGSIINTKSFSDKKILDKAIGVGIAAHEGQLFGWLNQLLGVLTAVGLIMVSASGFVLWRRRRPEKGLGAPPVLAKPSLYNAVVVILFIAALFLPLLLISIVVLFITEKILLRKIKPLSIWLGIDMRTNH